MDFNDHGFPVLHLSDDGWSTENEATATCFCGAVQLVLVSLYMPSSADSYDILRCRGADRYL